MQTVPSRLVQMTAAQKRVKGITLPLCGDAEDCVLYSLQSKLSISVSQAMSLSK